MFPIKKDLLLFLGVCLETDERSFQIYQYVDKGEASS